MPSDNEEYITTAEAAKALGVTRRWVQKLAKSGELPSYHPGRRWLRIRRADFEAYLAHQKASMPEVATGTDGLGVAAPTVTTDLPSVAGTLVVDLTKFG